MGALDTKDLPGGTSTAVESLPALVEGLPALLTEPEPAELEHWADDPLVPSNPDALDLSTILHALSDPVRLRIVCLLSEGGEHTCGSLDVPVSKSTSSHHFRVLREAGVIAQRADGKCRYNRLRADELEQRFPGLLDAVLRANRT